MDPWYIDVWEMTLRLGLAVAFGGLIGLEREKSNRAAGFRTNILVCLGSALIMLLSMYGFSAFSEEQSVRLDPARLAAQVISGIGFLGAGVILFNGFSITGLTTAATLWVVAAIGLAAGAGYYYAAAFTTFLVLFSLLILNKIERKWIQSRKVYRIEMWADPDRDVLAPTMNTLELYAVEIKHMSVRHADESGNENQSSRLQMNVILPKATNIRVIINQLYRVPGIREIRFQ